MFLARTGLKSFLLSLALGAGLAAQASAAGLTAQVGLVTTVGVQTNYTTTTKVVGSKTVYVEGTPMLSLGVSIEGNVRTYHFPFSGDKAKAWLEVLTRAAAAGTRVSIQHSDSYLSSGRIACANYAMEGCIELLGNFRAPLLQSVAIAP